MIKPWMLAYLDERMKEATQNFNDPFGGIAIMMFGDFDQQPPIGGSSLPHYAMKLLEQEYQRKNNLFFVKRNKQELFEINSNLCKTGVRLFKSAGHLKLTQQHRCASDSEHMANLNKMNSGSKITSDDFNLYDNLGSADFENFGDFLHSTIIVTGNYERIELNALMASLWAKYYNTHVIRWKRNVKYDKWKGRPRNEDALRHAEQQNCFYEYFVPRAPAYLSYNMNLLNELANGTLGSEHSLAFETPEEKEYLDNMIASIPIGGIIDLPQPPAAINYELFPDFPDDTAKDRDTKKCKRETWTCGSVVHDGRIVIPIGRHTGKYKNQSIRACRSESYYNASTVPMADHFQIELGFCITIPKAQGRTIHRLVASLSKHPSPFLRFRWEQMYVLLSRITGRNGLRLLLQMGDRNTLDYISDLEKDPYTAYYFDGFGKESSSEVSYWNADLAAEAAGFGS